MKRQGLTTDLRISAVTNLPFQGLSMLTASAEPSVLLGVKFVDEEDDLLAASYHTL